MSNQAQDPAFKPEDVDFEAIYQGKPPVEGIDSGFDAPPWDIGAPQPVVVDLEANGGIRSDVLDIGCGLGENALFLAEHGYQVVGVDGSETALKQARQRAADRGANVRFVPADATRLDGLEQQFDTVLDSALYHCLAEEQRSEYAAALHRVTRPGAQLRLFCFSDRDSQAFPLPMSVSQDDLRANLSEHWHIRSIEPTQYTTSLTRDYFESNGRGAFEAMGVEVDINAFQFDEQGRALAPVWHLHAVRK